MNYNVHCSTIYSSHNMEAILMSINRGMDRGFPDGSAAKTLCSQCRGPGQGTRSYMLQLRVHMAQLKILHTVTNISSMQQRLKVPHAPTKAWHNQAIRKPLKYKEGRNG